MNSKLREARSTSYIGSVPEEIHKKCVDEVTSARNQMSNYAGSVEDFALKMSGIGIQMGSSSSTDLSNFLFYNDSSDPEVIEQWMGLYQAQRDTPNPVIGTARFPQLQQINKNYSDSADNLNFKQNSQCSSTSTCNSTFLPDSTENFSNSFANGDAHPKHSINHNKLSQDVHRSMDVLPILKDNFRLLDLSTSNKQMPQSKLARSKEMPNIFSVIDDEDD